MAQSLRTLLYPLSDALGMDLIYRKTGNRIEGRKKRAIRVLGHTHQHDVKVAHSKVGDDYVAIAVDVIGDLCFVLVSINAMVTTIVVNKKKVDVKAVFEDPAVTEPKQLLEKLTPGIVEGWGREFVTNNKQGWQKAA